MPEWIITYLLVIVFFVLLVPAIIYVAREPETWRTVPLQPSQENNTSSNQ